ncbi:MAG TPA: hypothetical protein VFL98_02790 [Candidatus Paceibacterota bacterium]|nr:hypothetical protein [Candidatus Paceibacterota bacterium]
MLKRDPKVIFILLAVISAAIACVGLLGMDLIGPALVYGMGALAVAFIALALVPGAFSWWWKFAIWYVPLACYLFVRIIVSDIKLKSIPMWNFFNPPAYIQFLWIAGTYLFVSCILVALFQLLHRTEASHRS